MDEGKNLVNVKGTMDAKNLLSYLKGKIRESVEIVQPKKEEGGGDKKGKEGGGGDGEKKKDGGDGKKGEEAKVEANKMDYHGSSSYSSYYTVPAYSQGYVDHMSYGVPVYDQGYVNPGYNHGYVMEYSHPPPPPPPPTYLHAPPPQMFSDENPNACSVM